MLAGIETNDNDPITARIKEFYEQYPFPNYDGIQNFGDLVRRGTANSFTKALLDAIGVNKMILECGCGTGQKSHFLSPEQQPRARHRPLIVQPELAIDHKVRYNVARVGFTQMNIFDLGIKDGMFDVVISSGVLHHTKDARRAFASIVKKAKPGGVVVVGLYNWYGRVPTWLRSKLIAIFGPKIDYVVRKRIRDVRKAEIWIRDQYYNPHETWHSVDEVIEWFCENDIAYLNCVPRILGGKGTRRRWVVCSQ